MPQVIVCGRWSHTDARPSAPYVLTECDRCDEVVVLEGDDPSLVQENVPICQECMAELLAEHPDEIIHLGPAGS